MSDLFAQDLPEQATVTDDLLTTWLDGQVWAKNIWLVQHGPSSKRPHGEMSIEQKKNDIRILEEIRRRLGL